MPKYTKDNDKNKMDETKALLLLSSMQAAGLSMPKTQFENDVQELKVWMETHKHIIPDICTPFTAAVITGAASARTADSPGEAAHILVKSIQLLQAQAYRAGMRRTTEALSIALDASRMTPAPDEDANGDDEDDDPGLNGLFA